MLNGRSGSSCPNGLVIHASYSEGREEGCTKARSCFKYTTWLFIGAQSKNIYRKEKMTHPENVQTVDEHLKHELSF